MGMIKLPSASQSFFDDNYKAILSTGQLAEGEWNRALENWTTKYTGAKFAVATSNGTSALHISLLISGVENGHEVITQPITFVATCNAINYCNASPVFIDVDKDTMGMSPEALERFLKENTSVKDQQCINKSTGKMKYSL